MALKLNVKDMEIIFNLYVDQYKFEKNSGTELVPQKSKSRVFGLIEQNKKEWKTKTYEQIARTLLHDDILQIDSGAAFANFAPTFINEENLQKIRKFIDDNIDPDGERNEQRELLYKDLANLRNGINNIRDHMKNEKYRDAAVEALWEITHNNKLIRSIFSPEDGEDSLDILGRALAIFQE